MKFLHKLGKVFRAYSELDKAVSFACLGVVLLMVFKMIIFPYGVFNFGDENVYTEGLVGQNGFQNLDPLFVDYNELDREVCSLVFTGLMKYDSKTKAVVEDMASLTINKDKTEYTFVMKDGLKWQDGADLTADDVYFTFAKVVQDPSFENDVLKANFDGVQITEVDQKTIRFKLTKPNVFFLTTLTAGILPKHVLEKVAVEDLLYSSFNKMPVGSGPYMVAEPIQSFKDGRMQVTLKINPNYYGINPKIERFRLISYPTMDQLVQETSSINGIVKISGKYAETVKERGDFIMMPYELPQYMSVFINIDRVPNQKIRSALLKSIDKKELLSGLSDKIPIETPILQLNQKDFASMPDSAASKKALDDAKYKYLKVNSKFRTDEKGKVLTFVLIAREFPDGTQQADETSVVLDYLEKKWRNIGIDINTQLLHSDQLNERIMDRDYDLLFIGQTLGYSMDTYSYWHSTQVGVNGLNLSNYKSFQVDSLIEQIRTIFNPDQRIEKLKLIAKQLASDIPAIFLYKPVYYYASDGKVTGVNMTGVAFTSDRFSNISEWSFKNVD